MTSISATPGSPSGPPASPSTARLPVAAIAAWLGHADPAFTRRTYVHSQDDALRNAADALRRRSDTGATSEDEKE